MIFLAPLRSKRKVEHHCSTVRIIEMTMMAMVSEKLMMMRFFFLAREVQRRLPYDTIINNFIPVRVFSVAICTSATLISGCIIIA